MNKTWKVEVYITDSTGTTSAEWFLSSSFLLVQPLDLQSILHFDYTIHGHLLQEKHGAIVVQMYLVTDLCFALTRGLNLVGKQYLACL